MHGRGACMVRGVHGKESMHGKGCVQERRPLKRAVRILLE